MVLRRGTGGLVAASVALALFSTGQAASASTKPATTHLSLHATAASFHVGAPIALTGVVTPVTKAPVVLQRLVATKWVTIAHATANRTGAFTVAVKAPGKPATWTLRAVRPGNSAVKPGVSAAVKTLVVKAIYTISSAVAVEGPAISVTGKVTPKATGSVILQALVGKVWAKIGSAKLTAGSTFVIKVTRPVGTVALRVVRAAVPTIAGRTGATFHATVKPPTSVTPPTTKPVLAITSAALPDGTVGLAYTQQLTAVNGLAPYTWSAATGVLPAGLALSASGLLSGAATAVASTTFTVSVTDAALHSASALISVRFALSPSAVNSVLAWGIDDSGNLGVAGLGSKLSPTAITGLLGVVSVAAGVRNGYALRFDGSVWAWGNNQHSQLGITADNLDHPTPHAVPGLSNIIAVAAEGGVALALRNDGTVWAWGDNQYGQLGNGQVSQPTNPAPAQVAGLPKIIAVTAGRETSYALASDGTVWDWGDNSVGQLGDGQDDNALSPTHVPNLGNVAAIDGSGVEAVVLKGDGTVWNWGGDEYGELGFVAPQVFWSNVPVQVAGLTGIKAVAAGWFSTYAVASDGSVWSWGRNTSGELGDGTTSGRGPVHLSLTGVVSLSAANEAVCATLADGTLRTWGEQSDLILGSGVIGNESSPVTPPTTGHMLGCDIGQFNGFAVASP